MTKRAACIFYQRFDGKVLVVDRFNKSNVPKDYGLPGGKVELKEETSTAAIRECQEETGIDVWKLNITAYSATDARDGYHTTTYQALEVFGEELVQSDEGEALWVDPEELLGEQCTFRDYNRNVMGFFGVPLFGLPARNQ